MSEPNKRAHYGTSMAAIATNQGIGGYGGGEVIMIFPRKIESCRERLIDVAGRT